HHAGIKAGSGHADLKTAVLFQDLGHQLDQFDVVIDKEHLALAALQGIGRDAIVFHEPVERLARDAAEPGTWYPEALELSVVETANNGLLADLADFGGLAGRENGLHGFVHPLLAPVAVFSRNPSCEASLNGLGAQSYIDGPNNISP